MNHPCADIQSVMIRETLTYMFALFTIASGKEMVVMEMLKCNGHYSGFVVKSTEFVLLVR